MDTDNKYEIIHTYEEVIQLIERVGILPLASLIPEHPSLSSVTESRQWHSGTDQDPWSWRVRFPGMVQPHMGK